MKDTVRKVASAVLSEVEANVEPPVVGQSRRRGAAAKPSSAAAEIEAASQTSAGLESASGNQVGGMAASC